MDSKILERDSWSVFPPSPFLEEQWIPNDHSRFNDFETNMCLSSSLARFYLSRDVLQINFLNVAHVYSLLF